MKTEEYLEALRLCNDTKMLKGLWFVITKGQLQTFKNIHDELLDSDPVKEPLEEAIQNLENLSDAAVIHFAEEAGDTDLKDKVKRYEVMLQMDEEFYVH